ncbi:MAG: MBL fold metallo-hydrolase [Longimicrobiales bacterium]|nr:MBL fold metallo-hydrolase [Longimicrobiales bacterium]
MITIKTFTSRVFGQNAYLVRCDGTDRWLAIDPGGEAVAMAAALEDADGVLEGIVLTHAHLDHVEGVAELAERVPAPIHLHAADRPLYDSVAQQAAMFGHSVRTPPPPDRELVGGQELRLGESTFVVRHTPGHSPGHVILYEAVSASAFVGDVVFAGSIGRTDLPGGDYQQLMESIREQVLTLPDDVSLYTGHGPVTTVERERTTNPFLVPHHPGSRA